MNQQIQLIVNGHGSFLKRSSGSRLPQVAGSLGFTSTSAFPQSDRSLVRKRRSAHLSHLVSLMLTSSMETSLSTSTALVAVFVYFSYTSVTYT